MVIKYDVWTMYVTYSFNWSNKLQFYQGVGGGYQVSKQSRCVHSSIYPSIRLSVLSFSQDWFITVFWIFGWSKGLINSRWLGPFLSKNMPKMLQMRLFWAENQHLNFSQKLFFIFFLKMYLMTGIKRWIKVFWIFKEILIMPKIG